MNRDEEIKKLREEGQTLKFIGSKFGLTKERVRQICKKMGVEYRRHYDTESATLNALKAKSTYPSNLICVGADGHMVWIGDGDNRWVQVHNKRIREAIKEAYGLQYWIE